MATTQIWQTGGQSVKASTSFNQYAVDAGYAQVSYVPWTAGTFTATGSSVTVAQTAVTSGSQILITLKTAGGTVSQQTVQTITPGTGFTVNGGASDTSVYNYVVIG